MQWQRQTQDVAIYLNFYMYLCDQNLSFYVIGFCIESNKFMGSCAIDNCYQIVMKAEISLKSGGNVISDMAILFSNNRKILKIKMAMLIN